MTNKIRKTLLGCAVALATTFGAATTKAADPPAPMYVTTWSGFYLGGHLGWGWDKADMTVSTANFWGVAGGESTTIKDNGFSGWPSGRLPVSSGIQFRVGGGMYPARGQILRNQSQVRRSLPVIPGPPR